MRHPLASVLVVAATTTGCTEEPSVPESAPVADAGTDPCENADEPTNLALSVSPGGGTTCAVMDNHSVYCWGHQTFGQWCTDNDVVYDGRRPHRSEHLRCALDVAVGGYYTCAINPDRSVSCCGDNTYGELGDGSHASRPTPEVVPGLRGVQTIDASRKTVVVDENGDVYWWGLNGGGSSVLGWTATPRRVPLPEPAKMAAGGGHAICAVGVSGAAYCLGDNQSGILGNGTTVSSAEPVVVALPGAARTLDMGSETACAVLDADNAVWCWGKNQDGQLGDGTTETSPTPVRAGNLEAVQVAVGGSFACAITTQRAVSCWGNNLYGQLGDGTNVTRGTPGLVSVLTYASVVEAGVYEVCAIQHQVTYCWGDADSVGDGSGAHANVPTEVLW